MLHVSWLYLMDSRLGVLLFLCSGVINCCRLLRCADQLQRAVERGEYAEAARLLEAVQQLAAHFASFGSVPKVSPAFKWLLT